MSFTLEKVGVLILLIALSSLVIDGVKGREQLKPFKLGTFEINDRIIVGLVIDDLILIDIEAANADFQKKTNAKNIQIPGEMKALISAYDNIIHRFNQIITHLSKGNMLKGKRPVYVHDISSVKIKPPIMYPDKLLCAAANFRQHAIEGGMDPTLQEKSLPYLFMKPPKSTIIAHQETVLLPKGFDSIDWEIELGAVIGRRAKNISPKQAEDFIFGYTIVIDVSNRGGGNPNFGTNWFHWKAHDTFAPMGPFIVPKEFIHNPHDLRMKLNVNDQLMQDASSSEMINNQEELVAYASSISSLEPGDVIISGTPAGVGSGRKPPIFLKSGDVITATIDGIGTLINPVK